VLETEPELDIRQLLRDYLGDHGFDTLLRGREYTGGPFAFSEQRWILVLPHIKIIYNDKKQEFTIYDLLQYLPPVLLLEIQLADPGCFQNILRTIKDNTDS